MDMSFWQGGKYTFTIIESYMMNFYLYLQIFFH